MFVIFTAAVLIVTGAVALVALVGTWWILGLAFAIHLLMTTVVIATIASVIDGRSSWPTQRPQAKVVDRGRQPPAGTSVPAL